MMNGVYKPTNITGGHWGGGIKLLVGGFNPSEKY